MQRQGAAAARFSNRPDTPAGRSIMAWPWRLLLGLAHGGAAGHGLKKGRPKPLFHKPPFALTSVKGDVSSAAFLTSGVLLRDMASASVFVAVALYHVTPYCLKDLKFLLEYKVS